MIYVLKASGKEPVKYNCLRKAKQAAKELRKTDHVGAIAVVAYPFHFKHVQPMVIGYLRHWAKGAKNEY